VKSRDQGIEVERKGENPRKQLSLLTRRQWEVYRLLRLAKAFLCDEMVRRAKVKAGRPLNRVGEIADWARPVNERDDKHRSEAGKNCHRRKKRCASKSRRK
jgi:hypothetical protein